MIIGHLKCQQAPGELSSFVFGRMLGALRDSGIVSQFKQTFFPINVAVLCRSGGARLCLESAIAKLSQERPTLKQSADHAGSRQETKYWR